MQRIMNRMRGFLIAILIAKAGALSSVPRTKKCTNVSVHGMSPLIERRLRTYSTIPPSIHSIRGGTNTALASSPLSGVVQSTSIIDSIVPSGLLTSINAFFKYYPFIASFIICKWNSIFSLKRSYYFTSLYILKKYS